MEPLYTTGVASNYAQYSNEEFDDLIRQANGELDFETANGLYQEAEDILLEDMPVIPLWYETRHTVHTDNVRDRKSTRLNSSHVAISYAVFCLKKKTTSRYVQLNANITRD